MLKLGAILVSRHYLVIHNVIFFLLLFFLFTLSMFLFSSELFTPSLSGIFVKFKEKSNKNIIINHFLFICQHHKRYKALNVCQEEKAIPPNRKCLLTFSASETTLLCSNHRLFLALFVCSFSCSSCCSKSITCETVSISICNEDHFKRNYYVNRRECYFGHFKINFLSISQPYTIKVAELSQ